MNALNTHSPRRGFLKKNVTKIRAVRGALVDLITLCARGRLWLLPFVLVLAMSALLLGALTVFEYAAPFVYTLF